MFVNANRMTQKSIGWLHSVCIILAGNRPLPTVYLNWSVPYSKTISPTKKRGQKVLICLVPKATYCLKTSLFRHHVARTWEWNKHRDSRSLLQTSPFFHLLRRIAERRGTQSNNLGFVWRWTFANCYVTPGHSQHTVASQKKRGWVDKRWVSWGMVGGWRI